MCDRQCNKSSVRYSVTPLSNLRDSMETEIWLTEKLRGALEGLAVRVGDGLLVSSTF